jgi:hypothetical protein
MDISRFFIDRPRFATVLSIFIFLVGVLAIFRLPVSEYPEVAPPQVVVRAQFPGANPRVISETVATPLEEQINGVENLLYFDSQATADGQMTLTVTFKIGTNPDQAETAVQNRVNRALPRLPEIVRQIGVTTEKQATNFVMVVHLLSPDNRYDALYLRNYAQLNVRDELLRIPGIGTVLSFGSGDYAMRIWLDPNKLAARGLTASDVVNALREQNAQVAAGVVGAPPAAKNTDFQLAINTQGRLSSEDEFADVIVRAEPASGALVRIRDLGRVELSSNTYALRSLLNNKEAAAIGIFQAPGSNALALSQNVRTTMERLKANFPEGVKYSIVYDPTRFVQTSIEKVVETLIEAVLLVVLVVIVFLQTWRASIIPLLAVPISIVGTFAALLALGFSINTLTLFGLVLAIGIVVDDAIVVVENVERNIERGLTPHDATVQAMREVSGPIIAIALVLCAVCVQLPDAVAGVVGDSAATARRTEGRADARHGPRLRRLLPLVQPQLQAQQRGVWPRRHRHPAAQGHRARRLWAADCRHAGAVCAHPVGLRAGAGQAVPDRHRTVAGGRLARPYGGRDPRDERHRAEDPGHRRFGGLPRLVDRRLLRRAERRHRLFRPRRLRQAHVARQEQVRDPGQRQRRDPADPGRAHVRRAAAGGGRPGQRRRLQAAGAGPWRPWRAGVVRRGVGHARPGLRQPEEPDRHALFHL